MTETRAPVRSNKNQLFFPGSGVLRDQFLEFLGRNRLAEQIALKGMAAVQIEELMLRLGFHPLGDDIQPECRPRVMMACTMAASLGLVARSLTKDRSIFNWSSGSCLR